MALFLMLTKEAKFIEIIFVTHSCSFGSVISSHLTPELDFRLKVYDTLGIMNKIIWKFIEKMLTRVYHGVK